MSQSRLRSSQPATNPIAHARAKLKAAAIQISPIQRNPASTMTAVSAMTIINWAIEARLADMGQVSRPNQ
jgi:hypothetical protein